MSPFIESMPVDWLTQVIGAQGIALGQVQKLAANPDGNFEQTVLNRGLLFSSYMLYKSGVMSIEDQVDLAKLELMGFDHPKAAMAPDLIFQTLTQLYEIMDELYNQEVAQKVLISDKLGSKTTVQ
jgi:hypothetical protein